MDFIYKLFPYKSLYSIDGGTLTAWWVLVIIGIFIFYVFRVLKVTRTLRKRLQLHLDKFSEEKFASDTLFSQPWEDYQASFIDFNSSKKTDEYSYDFFNERQLLNANTNLKLLNSIPSTLVGLGILGTFIGLTYGISNFQTSSTEQIKESIETLLAGMGTAFVTSIYGMLLSLIFTFIEKVQVNSLHNSIHQLSYNLDKIYKISKEDERRMEFEKQEGLLREYFLITDDNNNAIKPGSVFRDIYSESQKQSLALQSFSTDLANLIEAGFEKILNDPDKGVMFELQSLKNEIVNLGSKLQDPATDMIDRMLEDLKLSLGEMVKEFKTTVSGSAKDELEGLTKILVQAGGSLNDFPIKLAEMTSTLNDNFAGLQDKVKEISDDTLRQSAESVALMKREVIEMSETLRSKVGDLQVGQKVLIEKQTDNIQGTASLLAAFESSVEKLNDLATQISMTVKSFEDVNKEINLTSGHFKNISENVLDSTNKFREGQLKFGEYSNEFLTNNEGTIEGIKSSLELAKDVSVDYADKFGIIENGLNEVFGQIQNGLNEYRESVQDSLKSYLSEYTSALTETTKALSGTASSQHEVVQDLNDMLDKFLRKVR